jgi:hypothetical protein
MSLYWMFCMFFGGEFFDLRICQSNDPGILNRRVRRRMSYPFKATYPMPGFLRVWAIAAGNKQQQSKHPPPQQHHIPHNRTLVSYGSRRPPPLPPTPKKTN